MCGIAGLVSLGASPLCFDPGQIQLMAAALAHRGPDDAGTWTSEDRRIALGHRRLSIVDLSPLGRNPMFWDGGRLAITYNGEIYNFLELRQELQEAGCRFRSRTDTEVVLAAYDTWGLDCVHRFVGMFAFALWDAYHRRVWLVRDRLGKKPLYYAEHGGSLLFASELKALLTVESLPRTIDRDALRLYLRYGYIPAPSTIFATVRKLEPGHYLICEDECISVARYWDPLLHVRRTSHLTSEDAESELESLLATAVRQRQIADVPLGAFLSGGIDSSLIVALMQEQNTRPVRTFTVRFTNREFNEANHAAAVARHLRTDHHERLCDETEMLGIVERLPDMFDEPFGDSSAIPTYLVSQAARDRVTVALSGDGGDELFFGYPRYVRHADAEWALTLPRPVRALIAEAARKLPTQRLRRIADVLSDTDDDTYARFVAWNTLDDVERITGGSPGVAPLYRDIRERAGLVPLHARPPLLDLVSYLPDDILTKVDRASMAVSLEVRAPLLDHRVVEFALGLPLRLKRRGRATKWLLRKLLYKRVPLQLVDRPKMGFGVPLRDWFRGPLRGRMDEYCRGSELSELGLDPRPIQQMWREFTNGYNHRPDLLWQAFVLVAWARRFVTARTPPSARSFGR